MNTPRWVRAAITYAVGTALGLHGLGVLIPSASLASAPSLRITEINWAGSVTDPADQWVEIVNAGASSVTFTDANPVTLSIGPSGSSLDITMGTAYGTLAAGHMLVVSHESLSTLHHLAGVTYVTDATLVLPVVATRYELTEPGALITDPPVQLDLIDDPDGAGPLTIPFTGAATPPASMARVDATASGSNAANWYTSRVVGTGFTAGIATQYGTPGAENVDMAAPSNLAITPASQTTTAVAPTISGKATVPGTDHVGVHVTRVSHDPSSFSANYVATPDVSGNWSVTATVPALPAGRYTIDVTAYDAAGDRSMTAHVPSAPSSTDYDYLVLPTVSTVTTPVIVSPLSGTLTNLATATVSGTLDTAQTFDSVEVLDNGMFYASFPASGSTFSFSQILAEGANVVEVIAVDSTGAFSLPASITINRDSIAPNPVDLSKVVLTAAQPGTQDSFLGLAGAAEGNTTLSVYADAALTSLIATAPVAADGSFPSIQIGDNTHAKVYLTLKDAAGNVSASAVLDNPIGVAGTITPSLVSVHSADVTVSWTSLPTAVKYRVKYRTSTGTYGAATEVCLTGNATCTFQTTINGLTADTDYVVAVAAVDMYGNESAYGEMAFHTPQAPVVVPVAAPVTDVVVKKTVAKKTTPVATASPSPTPSPTPTDKGDVKSADTQSTGNNWTPWIVLAVLVVIAVLAGAGYFYWFGGEAGEAALASVMAERAKREEEVEAEKPKPSSKKGGGGANRRW